MQSIFRLAFATGKACRYGELTGDAELKMDWTEPPTKLDAMGFYSGCLFFGDDQIAPEADCQEVSAVSIAVKQCVLGPTDRGDEDHMRARARCRAPRCLGRL